MGAAAIARQLGGARQGHNWRCACPLECGYSLSLSDGEDGKLLTFCFGGHEHHEILTALVQFGLLDDYDDSNNLLTPRPAAECIAHAAERIAQAREIYAGGVQDERLRIYLRSRGIELTSPVLRFTEQAPHRLGARLPAMLAPIVDVAGEQIGTHLTYLRPDGGAKAGVAKQHQHECRGAIRGGAIRLAEHDPDLGLIIAEGVETTFSAMEIFNLPGWSAVFAGELKTLELPPTVRTVIIAADHDLSGIGQRNALTAFDRWVGEGRRAQIKIPPDVGDDFNDVLTKRRNNARR